MLYSCQKTEEILPNPNDPSAIVVGSETVIPLGGNAYITSPVTDGTEAISKNGLINWSSPNAISSTFFRLGQTGKLDVYIDAFVPAGSSTTTIEVAVNGTKFNVNITGQTMNRYKVGAVNITKIGYVKVDFIGVNKGSNTYFASVSNIIISGQAASPNVIYANNPSTFTAVRKGASIQLKYTLPSGVNSEWFYNELTVPENGYRIGTYYMSNGFNGGSFGLQVNSTTDKKIIFMVTDNAGQKATIVRTGTNVVNSVLNNFVTGGQSTLNYDWTSGTTYKFLTQGKPDGFGNTIFSAWFFATETSEWKFIASWKRPSVNGYLNNVYSSLEGTNSENSYSVRNARYYNQWARDNNGTWNEIKNAEFSGDATASNLERYDFEGGVSYSSFYLKSNGFFPENVALQTSFTRSGTVSSPDIDFNNLP